MKRLIVGLTLLALAACETPSGTIVEKVVEPARTFVMFMPITSCSGSPPVCSTIMIPYLVHDDEDFTFILDDGIAGNERAYVDEQTYNSYDVGWEFDGKVYDDNVEKVRRV